MVRFIERVTHCAPCSLSCEVEDEDIAVSDGVGHCDNRLILIGIRR